MFSWFPNTESQLDAQMPTLSHASREHVLAPVQCNIIWIQHAVPVAIVTIFQVTTEKLHVCRKQQQQYNDWQLEVGYRASKCQSWNLTQSPLDSKTGAADPAALSICGKFCEWGTLHGCDLPASIYQLCPCSPVTVPWPTLLDLSGPSALGRTYMRKKSIYRAWG